MDFQTVFSNGSYSMSSYSVAKWEIRGYCTRFYTLREVTRTYLGDVCRDDDRTGVREEV